jgi:large subunit ribosomal protein L30e
LFLYVLNINEEETGVFMARKKSADAATSGSSLAAAIRQCVDSGKVEFGSNVGTKKAMLGKSKLVILASNCPSEIASDVQSFCKISGIPAITFEGTSLELGTIAGRPHPIAVLSVLEAGNSTIMQFVK